MTIKFVLPALLCLCGAAFVVPVHAADYRCMVFSGSDGTKPEASTNNDGKYAIKAADLEAAQANALATAKRYKKPDVTLTRAQCDPVAGASTTAAPASPSSTTAPSPAPATAPTSGTDKTMYCLVYQGSDPVPPPAALAAQGSIWRVPVKSIQSAEEDAVALASAQGKRADSAMCEGSLAAFGSESY